MGGLAPPWLAHSLIGIYPYLKALTCLQVIVNSLVLHYTLPPGIPLPRH